MELFDDFDVARDLKVEYAVFECDGAVVFDGGELVVGWCVAEACAVVGADEDEVGVGVDEGFEAEGPTLAVCGDVMSAGHLDDVVDEGVASGGEVAVGSEADDVVDGGGVWECVNVGMR